jgi:hypothetical protein
MSDEADFAALIEPVARRLLGEPNASLSTRTELRFGTHGSLSVVITGPKRGTWYDHEAGHGGGVLDLVRTRKQLSNGEALDWLRAEGLLAPPEAPTRESGRIIATYDYRAADGTLAFQVVRKEPKTFGQRRPNGSDWVWNMDGVERLPYHLPELLSAAREATIYVVEGEKDVDALHGRGLVSTTNPGGAGKWRANMSEYLRDHDVVILPDNDDAGEKHATDVTTKLYGIARSIRVLRLPDLPLKGDVSDWFAAGGTLDELERLAAEVPPYAPEAGPQTRRLKVLTPDDCESATPRPYIVKGLIGRGDSILLVGQPGAGKSVVGPYIGYAVAQGRPVFNRRVHRGAVLYVASEDGHGMKLRVRALRRRWGDAPDFHLLPDAIDLKDPNSWHLAALAELIQQLRPTLIIIDTLARTFPGLKENEPDAPDGMGRVVMVVREITNSYEAAVMTLHHMPKDGATPRGHSTLNGDADVTLVVEGATGQPRLVRLIKNRNGPSDATLTFSIRSEPLGEDEDGDIITAAIAEETEPTAADGLRAKEAKLRDKPAFVLRELRNLTIHRAEPLSLSPDGPVVSAVPRRSLREALIKSGWFPENLLRTASNGTVELDRAGYPSENHALDSLKRAGFLAFNRDWVWLL